MSSPAEQIASSRQQRAAQSGLAPLAPDLHAQLMGSRQFWRYLCAQNRAAARLNALAGGIRDVNTLWRASPPSPRAPVVHLALLFGVSAAPVFLGVATAWFRWVGVVPFLSPIVVGVLLALLGVAAMLCGVVFFTPRIRQRLADTGNYEAIRSRFRLTSEQIFSYFQQNPTWAIAYLHRADAVLADELKLLGAQIERAERAVRSPHNTPERGRHERVLASLVAHQNNHLRLRADCAATIAEAELALLRNEPLDGLATFMRNTQAYIEAQCEVDRATKTSRTIWQRL